MSSYILVGRNYDNKQWWNDLVRACAVIGDPFEIHCWFDEKAEITAALRFGHEVTSTWSGGTVISGIITQEFISYLIEAPKPADTEIYNKMTPFFSIFFGGRFYSEHYGTEVTVLKVARKEQPAVDHILDQISDVGIVYRNV